MGKGTGQPLGASALDRSQALLRDGQASHQELAEAQILGFIKLYPRGLLKLDPQGV